MEKKINYVRVTENIRAELKDYVQKSNLKSLVLGISGGIDSALVAALARPVCDELGIPLIGRSITITASNKKEERDRADAVGEAFCTDYKEVDLTDVFEVFSGSIDKQEGSDNTEISGRIRKGNLKSRMRMCLAYEIAHRNGGCVLGTDNLTESASMGCAFYTIGGDGTYDLNPISGLWKTQVYGLATYLISYKGTNFLMGSPCTNSLRVKALRSCTFATASDGLGVTDSGSDLDQLGKDSYDEVDSALIRYHDLCGLRDRGVLEGYRGLERELEELKNDVVIKRHIAGKFKAYLPIEFTSDIILKGAFL